MFRNRWLAITFVLMTAVSAASLVGTEEGDGTLMRASRDLVEQNAARDAASAQTYAQMQAPVDAPYTPTVERRHFTPDAELIDDAAGIDPLPTMGHDWDDPAEAKAATEPEPGHASEGTMPQG